MSLLISLKNSIDTIRRGANKHELRTGLLNNLMDTATRFVEQKYAHVILYHTSSVYPSIVLYHFNCPETALGRAWDLDHRFYVRQESGKWLFEFFYVPNTDGVLSPTWAGSATQEFDSPEEAWERVFNVAQARYISKPNILRSETDYKAFREEVASNNNVYQKP